MDIYLDAAGAPAVLHTVLGNTKLGSTLGIVGIHKQPFEVDFQMLIPAAASTVVTDPQWCSG